MSVPKPVTPQPSQLASALLLGLFAVTAFGATLPVTHIALAAFPPLFLTFARAILATLLAVLALTWFRRPLLAAATPGLFIAGFCLIFAFPGFMAIAMQTVPAAHGGVVLGFLPLATAAIARLIADEAPSPLFWALSIAGSVIVTVFIFVRSGQAVSSATVIGYLWLIAAGLSAACGYVLFGKLSRHTPGWEIISRALIINAPLSVCGLLWTIGTMQTVPGGEEIAALVYLGSVSMYLAFCAWNAALALGGIARIGQLQLLQVFITIAVSAALLGEELDSLTLVSAVAITAVIAASRRA